MRPDGMDSDNERSSDSGSAYTGHEDDGSSYGDGDGEVEYSSDDDDSPAVSAPGHINVAAASFLKGPSPPVISRLSEALSHTTVSGQGKVKQLSATATATASGLYDAASAMADASKTRVGVGASGSGKTRRPSKSRTEALRLLLQGLEMQGGRPHSGMVFVVSRGRFLGDEILGARGAAVERLCFRWHRVRPSPERGGDAHAESTTMELIRAGDDNETVSRNHNRGGRLTSGDGGGSGGGGVGCGVGGSRSRDGAWSRAWYQPTAMDIGHRLCVEVTDAENPALGRWVDSEPLRPESVLVERVNIALAGYPKPFLCGHRVATLRVTKHHPRPGSQSHTSPPPTGPGGHGATREASGEQENTSSQPSRGPTRAQAHAHVPTSTHAHRVLVEIGGEALRIFAESADTPRGLQIAWGHGLAMTIRPNGHSLCLQLDLEASHDPLQCDTSSLRWFGDPGGELWGYRDRNSGATPGVVEPSASSASAAAGSDAEPLGEPGADAGQSRDERESQRDDGTPAGSPSVGVGNLLELALTFDDRKDVDTCFVVAQAMISRVARERVARVRREIVALYSLHNPAKVRH